MERFGECAACRRSTATRLGSLTALAVLLLLLILAVPGWALAASPNVSTHTQGEIRERVAESGASVDRRVIFTGQPDMVSPYEDAGTTCYNQTQLPALAMLNNMRYIAGLDADVEIDHDMVAMTQAAAYVNAVNGKLSHYPDKPNGMSDSIYELGYAGAGRSNLASGYRTLGAAIVYAWMSDADSSNVDRVGHRRWVLNSEMGKTGFGVVNRHYAMYAFDSSAAGEQTNVAWPAQQMPLDYFDDNDPWSLSVGHSIDASKVAVKLVRESDGKTWNFQYGQDTDPTKSKYFNIDNASYGQPGCIIFRPDDVSYKSGDVFDVEITGATSDPIVYKVNFFELNPVTDVSLDQDSLSVEVNGLGKLTATVSPSNATSSKVTWTSSNEGVATVNYEGFVIGKKAGRAVITASAGGKSAQATVTVVKTVSDISFTKTPSQMRVGQTYQFEVKVTPGDAANGTVTWSSSDESIATVDSNGLVTAIAPGYVEITAKAGGYWTRAYRTVEKALVDISGATVTVADCTYTGGDLTPQVTVVLNGEALVQGTDYTVSYSDNVGPGTATATITGAGDYDGTVTKKFEITKPQATEPSGKEASNSGNTGGTDSNSGSKGGSEATSGKKTLQVGDLFTVKDSTGKFTYEITGTNEVALYKANVKKNKSVTINSVTFEGITYRVTKIGALAFQKTKAKKVVIGENVKSVGTSAFSGSKYLKSVVIGPKVEEIGMWAFDGAKKLKTLTIESTALTKSGVHYAFADSSITKVKVPASKKAEYKRIFTKASCGKKVKVTS